MDQGIQFYECLEVAGMGERFAAEPAPPTAPALQNFAVVMESAQPSPVVEYVEPVVDHVAPVQAEEKTIEILQSHTLAKIVEA